MKWKFWIIGGYIRFKALAWAILGLAIGWGFVRAEEMGWRDPLRYLSYYIIVFVVPAVLLWVLGVAVHMGYTSAWWFGIAYFASALIAKTLFGHTEMPTTMWTWVTERLPLFYLRGFYIFHIFTTLIMAVDAVALVALMSRQGRLYFGVRKPRPEDTGFFSARDFNRD